MLQLLRIGAHCALARAFQELRADLQVDGHILIRSNSFQEVLVPGLEGIDPAGNGVDVLPEPFDGKFRSPVVVAERVHRDFGPRFVIFMPVSHYGCNRVVPVCEDIGLNNDRFADNPLDRKPPAFEFRFHPSNDHSFRRPLAHM